MTFAQETNRARMMNQKNKAGWLQRQVEAGNITSHADLVTIASKISASSKVLFMVQDYFGTNLPSKQPTTNQ
jgi:MOSC domain-containing protein YiiM